MAARHKYADNGVDVDTVLEVADLETICATAAAESTGDLWKGSQRIDLADSGDGWRVYEIRPARLLRQVLLNFAVEVREMNGRRTLTSTIRHYRTSQPTVLAFIPAGPKSMVAHHTYMQFAHKVANTVRESDPAAVVRIREGVQQAAELSWPSQSSEPQELPQPAPMPDDTASDATGLLPPPPPPPAVTVVAVPAALPSELVDGDTELDDQTRRVVRRSPQARAWEVGLPRGDRFAVSGTMILGRNPAPSGSPGEILVSVGADQSSVSKTHARLDVVDGLLTVTDLDSRFGTAVVTASGDVIECEPRVAVRVHDGWEIECGSCVITVRSTTGERS